MLTVSGQPVLNNKCNSKEFVNFVSMNRRELINRVKETVRSVDPKARVILFGSRARGDSNNVSDWDFLILVSKRADEKLKRQIRDKLIDTELEAEQVISTLIYSQDRWPDYKVTPLYKNVFKEGLEV
jgi:predicted nucleotidyltransferase